MDHAQHVSRRSSPPPGFWFPPDYKWSTWWDTREGCFLLLCAFGAASLMLWAVTAVTSGWVETGIRVLAGFAFVMALRSLFGVVFSGESGWYRDND
jgi:hypothetical protein